MTLNTMDDIKKDLRYLAMKRLVELDANLSKLISLLDLKLSMLDYDEAIEAIELISNIIADMNANLGIIDSTIDTN